MPPIDKTIVVDTPPSAVPGQWTRSRRPPTCEGDPAPRRPARSEDEPAADDPGHLPTSSRGRPKIEPRQPGGSPDHRPGPVDAHVDTAGDHLAEEDVEGLGP